VERRRLLWQLFAPAFLILVLSELVLAGLASWTAREITVGANRERLLSEATLLARLLEDEWGRGKLPGEFDALIDVIGGATQTRITIIDPAGTVLADSAESPAAMVNHGDRPEVKAALSGTTGVALRWSTTVGKELLYVALPPNPRLGGAIVRTALPSLTLGEILDAFSARVAIGAITLAALGAAIALLVARRVTRPLEDVERAARRFADGDLSFRAPVTGSGEIAGLARTLNQMAAQLDERFRLIAEQRNEQEALLSSMVEGVLAVDADERVSTMNLAAGRLLGIEPHRALGRSIQEVTRNPDVQRFVSTAGRSNDVVEGEITLHTPDARVLQGHGARILDARGRRVGTVVVLNDVTKLRRLEMLRRDFVANVSHELKTPITSIKGFVATLLDGALENPQDASRFLEIVARHADRLSAIIDDLLSLSRIEQEDEGGTVETARVHVRDTLRRAVDASTSLAADRQIGIVVECKDGLVGIYNDRLVEQAVANLVENAVKYSDPGSAVEVSARRTGTTTEIAVKDHGCGIEARHLDRLFERFYRVDKARSRKLGGTGLGLAIVKHIAVAHGGTVQVATAPGLGSTFTLRIPDASRPSVVESGAKGAET
jgi:two-component system phosphate regulon sensor histidine kinase PhoR